MVKKNKLGGLARQTMGTGMMSVMGSGIMGQVGTATGAPASAIGAGQGAMNLIGVGNLARAGMGVASMMGGGSRKKRRK